MAKIANTLDIIGFDDEANNEVFIQIRFSPSTKALSGQTPDELEIPIIYPRR